MSLADTLLERTLELQSDNPPALHLQGQIRLAQHRLLDAVPLLERAVQEDPLPEFRWSLYEALRAAGQDKPANDQKTELLRIGGAEDSRTFSLFLTTVGDAPGTALRLALRELKQRADVFTLDAVAWALSGVGGNLEALDYSRRALAKGTQIARLFLHAGIIAARTGNSTQALELLAGAEDLQQMLLPSERQRLKKEFADLQPRIDRLVSDGLSH